MHPTPTLEEAYKKYYQLVYGLCIKILKDKVLAQDAAHDVFIHLSTRLDKFRGDSSFTTFVYRVTFNFLLSSKRGKQNKWNKSHSSLEALADDYVLEQFISKRDAHLESTVERIVLERALSKLPTSKANILRMHLEGFNHRDVAAIENYRNPLSSKSAFYRARKELKEVLCPTKNG